MPIAGKNAIHILRGANVKTNSSIAALTLSNGQPLYDTQTGYLYIGEGNTIANTMAVKASYADNANSATYASYLSYILPISDGGTGGTNAKTAMKNLMMNVATSTNPGNSEYLVFATSTTAYRYNYGYIKNDILSEVSTSSVTNANYANFAGTAYSVSASNISGVIPVSSGGTGTTTLRGAMADMIQSSASCTSISSSMYFPVSTTSSANANRVSIATLSSYIARDITSDLGLEDCLKSDGFVDSGYYNLSTFSSSAHSGVYLFFCTYGDGGATLVKRTAQGSSYSNVSGIRGPLVIIDNTRGSDSSMHYYNSAGAAQVARFNANSYTLRFEVASGNKWLVVKTNY